MLSSEHTLSELLMRKEEEWRALQAQHNQLQEAALQEAQCQLEEAREKLQRLQEDFIYNLQVLEERDHELEHYDTAFAQARGQEEARQAEVSELKIEVAKLKKEVAREARHVGELQEQLWLRSQEHRLELDRIHSDKNGEIDHQREQYESLKWTLERKLEEVDSELALQRQELLLQFESRMQKREHEFRLQADSMSSTVLAHELKVKQLSKELEALKAARAQASEGLQRAETVNAELEQKLQCYAWELQDLEAMKDARIKDLEDTLHSIQLTRKKEEETFNRKLQEEAADLKASWDAQVAQMSKEAVSKDLQAQVLQEEMMKLKAQLAGAQQDMDRYKQQLSQAVERERSLERAQVQLGLDWQRRCDAIERDQIQKSEALIRGLTESRDQVSAKLQETEQALQEQEVVLQAVSLERNRAMQELRTHGLLPGQDPQVPLEPQEEVGKDFASGEILRLQEQNSSLRRAVARMRREMETLSGQLPPLPPSSEGDCPATPGDSVCAEQVSPGLGLRKLGDRVHVLTLLVTKLKKKVQPQPLELDTVQQELPQEVDQVYLEVLELRKQVTELQKYLGTPQQEGEEPPGRKSLQKEGLTGRTPMGTRDQEHLGTQSPQASSVSHLQRKLKEASRKILNLHLQREQLIEMGNRLRAELGHPRGRPPHHSQLPSPELLDIGNVPTEPWKPLGQLQPCPKAQDLSLLQTEGTPGRGRRGRPSSAQLVGKNPTRRGSKAAPTLGPMQGRHSIPMVTCKSHQKENRAPEPPQAPAAPEESGHESHGSSSLASCSLQDIWKLLDLGSSPSGLPSQDESTPESPAHPAVHKRQEADRSPAVVRFQETLAIKGMKMAAHSRARPSRPSSSRPMRSAHCWPAVQIRNYNMKD